MRVSAAVHVSAGEGPGCDYRFFALLRNDSELDLALLYVKTASATCPCEIQFDPSDILISFYPHPRWRETF
jgi:hypothetical protein